MSRPVCPKCGTPARYVVVRMARVECELEDDGSAGRVIHVRRGEGAQEAFRCSGKHEWQVTP